MIVRLHRRQEGGLIVAVCDSDLVGKRFEESGLQLDLTGQFYRGEERSDEEVGDLLRNADHVNFVGERSVALALREGLIDAVDVRRVAGVPHAEATLAQE